MEGFPWDDLRKIFGECQRMTKVPNGVEILQKLSTRCVGRTDVTDRQTDDRQTNDRQTKDRWTGEAHSKRSLNTDLMTVSHVSPDLLQLLFVLIS